jgi:hypothetical protein
MHLEKLFTEAFPHVDAATIEGAAAELRARNSGDPDPKGAVQIAELKEELSMCRTEIARLNTQIVLHRQGYQNASNAALDVLGERVRQRSAEGEGYDDVHDDEHDGFELTYAAIAYLVDAIQRARGETPGKNPPSEWPWNPAEFKRKKIKTQFKVAATLVIAEMERMDRAGLDI